METMKLKTAWIHDGKEGDKSFGHFNCDCGNKIENVEYGDIEFYDCVCGKTYSSKGWLVLIRKDVA